MKITAPGFLFSAFLMLFNACSAPEADIRIAAYRNDAVCAISYTFDDGMKEHYTMAAPELEKRGFRGTFWVNCNSIGINPQRMTPEELREMAATGHEISNHSWSHKKLTTIPVEEIVREIQRNDTAIYNYTGIFPVTFCYPFNASDEEVRRLASQGRVATRTTQYALGSRQTPEYLQNRLEELISNGGWDVAMTHGITYGYDSLPDPSVMWDHLDKVDQVRDKVWVGTFREVASYVAERDDLDYEVNIDGKRFSVSLVSTLDPGLFNEPLTVVVEGAGLRSVTARQDGRDLDVTMLKEKALFDIDPHGGTVTGKLK